MRLSICLLDPAHDTEPSSVFTRIEPPPSPCETKTEADARLVWQRLRTSPETSPAQQPLPLSSPETFSPHAPAPSPQSSFPSSSPAPARRAAVRRMRGWRAAARALGIPSSPAAELPHGWPFFPMAGQPPPSVPPSSPSSTG